MRLHAVTAGLLACATSALALQAKWTPAADGGPSRFSKRYRDSIGQDDSRWTGDSDSADSSWVPELFPSSASGWAGAALAALGIAYLVREQRLLAAPGERVGGSTAGGAGAPGAALPWGRAAQGGVASAGEAARAAFLRKYDS